MARKLSHDEIRTLLDNATASPIDYSIGFVRLTGGPQGEDATLAGSGTLVRAFGTRAVLTACHVLEHLPKDGEVGLVLPARGREILHRPTIRMEFAEKRLLPRGTKDCDGPDLGLLLLAPQDADRIGTEKVFYDLERQRDLVLSGSLVLDVTYWMLCGMVEEWTCARPPELGFQRVKEFRGSCGIGIILAEESRGGFDYLDFGVRYVAGYQVPGSFGGVSGGGLWHALVEDVVSQVLGRLLLAGVAFYETPIEQGQRKIRCHGPRSVYRHAMGALRSTIS